MSWLTKYTNGNEYSRFWIDSDQSNAVDAFLGVEETVTNKRDLVALAGYRRAISNFVNIVTGHHIPVTFTDGNDSYTTGDKVVIGANLNDKNFDVAVGLALHEGSHILLSDFDLLKDLDTHISEKMYEKGLSLGLSRNEVLSNVKSILNYVEDRRIDWHIFSTSPGYKGYYHSMYDKYFYSKSIDKGLKSGEYREEDWDSYIFRIINLHNTNTDLSALSGLREIYQAINLPKIARLKDTASALKIALKVYKIVQDNIEAVGDSQNGNESGSEENGTGDESLEGQGDNGAGEEGQEEGGNATDGQIADMMSDRQKGMLDKAINKQKDFIDGNIKKTKMSKKDKSDMKTLEEAGASYEDVTVDNHWGTKQHVKCTVVRNYTKSVVDSNQFRVCSEWNGSSYDRDDSYSQYNFVEEGLRLGSILGRKLQIRGEERTLKYTRKDAGRIDRRLISELGFGNANVFSQTFTDTYKKAHLHLSIDGSGSMGGTCWNKAMTSAVAMCKAADMAGNIGVTVTVRTTENNSPFILVAYDSRNDKLNKIKQLFKYLQPGGTTPEGLTFAAIMKDLIPTSRDMDSYFINYSDGMPMFNNKDIYYCGESAVKHTRKMSNEIRNMGIKLMSYFIQDGDYQRDSQTRDFKTMYGVDSQFVDATNMMEVARTMNKKFLEK